MICLKVLPISVGKRRTVISRAPGYPHGTENPLQVWSSQDFVIPLWLTEGIEIKMTEGIEIKMAEDIESNDHVNFYDISINYRINSKISLHEK